MKETDYNVIAMEINSQISDNSYDIVSMIGTDATILCVMGIYLSNDITSGYGQNFNTDVGYSGYGADGKVSVISSPERISVITIDGMSYYKSDLPICGYESLDEDIANILILIQTVLDRISSRS